MLMTYRSQAPQQLLQRNWLPHRIRISLVERDPHLILAEPSPGPPRLLSLPLTCPIALSSPRVRIPVHFRQHLPAEEIPFRQDARFVGHETCFGSSVALGVIGVREDKVSITAVWVSGLVTRLSGCVCAQNETLLVFLVEDLADGVADGGARRGTGCEVG